MSIENAISDHAAALRELAAAIREAGARVTTTHSVGPGGVAVTKTEPATGAKEKPAADPKPQSNASEKPATAKPSATQKANASASSIDYTETIKPKILAFAKQPEGRDKLTALLARFGVTKGPDLTSEQHAEFNTAIDRAIAGEWDPRDADPGEGGAEPEDEGMA